MRVSHHPEGGPEGAIRVAPDQGLEGLVVALLGEFHQIQIAQVRLRLHERENPECCHRSH